MVRVAWVALFLVTAVLTGWAYKVGPPSHGIGPYPDVWVAWLTLLAAIGAVSLLFLSLAMIVDRGKWNFVGATLATVLFLVDAWFSGFWVMPSAKIRFGDGGFTGTRYSVEHTPFGSMVINSSHRTVRFCYGRGGACDPAVHTSSTLDSPGATVGPGQYVVFHYPNRTADYPITAILDGPSTAGFETALHIAYHDRSKDPPG